jgi:hypothetical protein
MRVLSALIVGMLQLGEQKKRTNQENLMAGYPAVRNFG